MYIYINPLKGPRQRSLDPWPYWSGVRVVSHRWFRFPWKTKKPDTSSRAMHTRSYKYIHIRYSCLAGTLSPNTRNTPLHIRTHYSLPCTTIQHRRIVFDHFGLQRTHSMYYIHVQTLFHRVCVYIGHIVEYYN